MTVKELKDELAFFEDDDEIEFKINCDIDCESWTEDRWGNKSVNVDSKLKVDFMGNIQGNCYIEMVVDE